MKLVSIDLTDMRKLLQSIGLEESQYLSHNNRKFIRTYCFAYGTLSGEKKDSSKQLGIYLYTAQDLEKIKEVLIEQGFEVKVTGPLSCDEGLLKRSRITVFKLSN